MKNKKSMMNLAISNLFLVFLGAGLVIPVLPTLKEQMHFSGTTNISEQINFAFNTSLLLMNQRLNAMQFLKSYMITWN